MYSTAVRTAARYGPRAWAAIKPYKSYIRGQLENEAAHQAYNMYRRFRKRGRRFARRVYRRASKRFYGSRKRRRRATQLSSQKRPRLQLGDSLSQPTICKRNIAVFTNGFSSLTTKNLYENRITSFPERSLSGAISLLGNRERDVINYVGFSMEITIVNNLFVPLYFNMAVIIPHDTNATVIPTTDFFRNDGGVATSPADERAEDFGAGLPAIIAKSLPINTDKYSIMKRWTYTIGPKAKGATLGEEYNPDKPNFKRVKRWFPIRRKLAFDDQGSTFPNNGNIFVVYWAWHFGETAGDTPTLNAYQVEDLYMNYWRDINY